MGQETPAHTGAEAVARKFNFAVVYFEINKIKRGYYDMSFKLIHDSPKNTNEGEVTEKITRELEKTIRKNPEYWMWTHNRWKHKREN